MKNQEFEQRIEKYLKRQFGITISAASKRQVYEALMSTVREKLSEKKFAYEQELKKTKQKRAYYMSMEFLVGRTLRNNLFNLGVEKEIKEWFKTINIAGIPLNEQELLNAVFSGEFVTLAKAEF